MRTIAHMVAELNALRSLRSKEEKVSWVAGLAPDEIDQVVNAAGRIFGLNPALLGTVRSWGEALKAGNLQMARTFVDLYDSLPAEKKQEILGKL